MKPKILFIMHMPPPVHGAAMMGKYVHDSKAINEEFDCVYINPSASKDVAYVGKISLWKIRFFFSNLITIIKTVKREKPDLCYLTPTSDGWGIYRDMLTIAFLKLSKKKIILHFHNKGVNNFSRRRFSHFAYKMIFTDVKIILLAQELYEDVKVFVKHEDVFLCPNGIPETQSGLFMRNQFHAPYTFLFLSNMIESKGVYILLNACAVLKQKGFQFKCNFVGRWSDVTEESFSQKLEELDLTDSVTAYGAKYGSEKNIFLETADAFVFPTLNEAFGLVLLEAMEAALPCISANEGGIPSVIEDSQTGFIVSSRNVEELADKMIWLIQNPDKGLEMGKEGRKRFLEKFTLRSFEGRLATILRQNLI